MSLTKCTDGIFLTRLNDYSLTASVILLLNIASHHNYRWDRVTGGALIWKLPNLSFDKLDTLP
jgi:hypothetical protein